MGRKKTKNKRNSEMKVIFFIILVAAAMFIISTYAWFSTQKNVSITNLEGTVQVAEGLEISLNAQDWYNGIELGTGEGQLDIVDPANIDVYSGHRNIHPSEMLPVSTLGLITNNNMQDISMIRGTITNQKVLSKIAKVDTDGKNDETGELIGPTSAAFPGYFAFDIFLKNSSKSDTVEDILQLNFDSFVEIKEASKSVTGLQNTIRVAFAKYGGTKDAEGNYEGVAEVTAKKDDVLKYTAGIGVGASSVYLSDCAIWEPNSDRHEEYIINNNNRVTWNTDDAKLYANETLADGVSKGFGYTTQMPTYGLTDDSIGKTINDVYLWDGTNKSTEDDGTSKLLVKKQNVLQTKILTEEGKEKGWILEDGVQNLITTSDTKDVNDLDKDGDKNEPAMFTLPPNKISRLRVYVWLEGQDVDCINWASHGGAVKIDIGLVKGSQEGWHAEDIEE